MSANNACCVIRYTAVGKAAVVLTSIVSAYAILLAVIEHNNYETSGWRIFLLLVIGLGTVYAASVLYYGIKEGKPDLLKFYSRMCVAISLLFLLTEAFTRGPETSPNVVGMIISGLLLLLSAGIVWRCRLIMVKVASSTNSASESPLAATESSTSTDGDRIGDDPPSYRDVVHRSPPEESSSIFTVPLPHERDRGFSYGSLNTLPPPYHLAVSQMSYEKNTSPSDVILRPSDITLPSQAPAVHDVVSRWTLHQSNGISVNWKTVMRKCHECKQRVLCHPLHGRWEGRSCTHLDSLSLRIRTGRYRKKSLRFKWIANISAMGHKSELRVRSRRALLRSKEE
ncbi:uncharacterized protein LOC108681143 [Hyalella azteca]|uniref:Uncharacterized protein LOC108681143 n=1 Tax=Hyalella azteca TaxID=294128 RepID=A0A8B7PJH4_HYAAZ|nr:uncharacterized protein LOC108681143 [Hyalella azteca]